MNEADDGILTAPKFSIDQLMELAGTYEKLLKRHNKFFLVSRVANKEFHHIFSQSSDA